MIDALPCHVLEFTLKPNPMYIPFLNNFINPILRKLASINYVYLQKYNKIVIIMFNNSIIKNILGIGSGYCGIKIK
jgi:hypothetical protein